MLGPGLRERINWEMFRGYLEKNNCTLMRIGTIADGSCYFHAIADAIFVPYQTGYILSEDGTKKKTSKQKIVKDMREDLALVLSQKNLNHGKTYYDMISRGELGEISKCLPEYTLENMQKELRSSNYVDEVYNELISNILDTDIYVLDKKNQDVQMQPDMELYYKNRKSIVLLFCRKTKHYELCALINSQGVVETIFHHDNPFIKYIRNRMLSLIKSK